MGTLQVATNRKMKQVNDWFVSNTLNRNKTTFMVLTRSQERKQIKINVVSGFVEMNQVKYLGALGDNQLTRHQQILPCLQKTSMGCIHSTLRAFHLFSL